MTDDQLHRYQGTPSRAPLLIDVLDELVDGWTTRELVTQPEPARGAHPASCAYPARWRPMTRSHVVHHRSLLEQLQVVATGRTGDVGDEQRAAGSRVMANVEAMALLDRVTEESAAWLRAAGRPVPSRLRPRLRALVDAAPLLAGWDDERGRSLGGAARSWWSAARVLAAWDSAAWRPRAVCPVESCERWNTLRVRGTSILDGDALCTACMETWSGEAFLELARWVKWSTVHLAGPEHLSRDDDGAVLRDEAGLAVQCPECLPRRDAMADRARARHLAALGLGERSAGPVLASW